MANNTIDFRYSLMVRFISLTLIGDLNACCGFSNFLIYMFAFLFFESFVVHPHPLFHATSSSPHAYQSP